ncbi:Translation initiation factor IF2/IF5, zinc-binding [Pseudocohnilembus persalinus]|uniref:Translation initiation factor IF2/IF5, zinc-binding n=1 Tax=Pseudocohnilembus persalinus TaxID=266149 RepID=A0A0V0QUG1_PSEPJ|nr:Translation initiation factor IF2/IF5, zinc-binding [Pseudocohnilembus persalinus]|eukprot:KRX05674.1 Translation initiation factor IF2/IF5, zinc-binding [Pseudocohnilembus persalinus]
MISLSAILRLKHRIPLELRSQASQGVVSTKVGDRLGSPPALNKAVNFEVEYQKLLDRIVNNLRQNNPDLGEKTKLSLKPPQVQRVGRKVQWTNFGETCKKMNRDKMHVQQFIQNETGKECIISSDELLIKQNLTQNGIQQLIKKYIQEYVKCSLCSSTNTALQKDTNTRLYMIQCQNCKSSNLSNKTDKALNIDRTQKEQGEQLMENNIELQKNIFNLGNQNESLQSFKCSIDQEKFISQDDLLKQYLLKKRTANYKNTAEFAYHNFEKKTKKLKIYLDSEEYQSASFECPICQDQIIGLSLTKCGHQFCEKCLNNSLVHKPNCPCCRSDLKNTEQFKCTILNDIKNIGQSLDNQEQQQITVQEEQIQQEPDDANSNLIECKIELENQQQFLKQIQEYEKWKKTKFDIKFEIGQEIDVQDTENIWCVAIIKDILDIDNEKNILIHYKGWNSVYDEVLSYKSDRLAPKGFYTSRKNIPQYATESENDDLMSARTYQSWDEYTEEMRASEEILRILGQRVLIQFLPLDIIRNR